MMLTYIHACTDNVCALCMHSKCTYDVCTCILSHTHTHARIYMHTHIYAHTHTHTHTHTQTNTQDDLKSRLKDAQDAAAMSRRMAEQMDLDLKESEGLRAQAERARKDSDLARVQAEKALNDVLGANSSPNSSSAAATRHSPHSNPSGSHSNSNSNSPTSGQTWRIQSAERHAAMLSGRLQYAEMAADDLVRLVEIARLEAGTLLGSMRGDYETYEKMKVGVNGSPASNRNSSNTTVEQDRHSGNAADLREEVELLQTMVSELRAKEDAIAADAEAAEREVKNAREETEAVKRELDMLGDVQHELDAAQREIGNLRSAQAELEVAKKELDRLKHEGEKLGVIVQTLREETGVLAGLLQEKDLSLKEKDDFIATRDTQIKVLMLECVLFCVCVVLCMFCFVYVLL
jgi:hypothetical protein